MIATAKEAVEMLEKMYATDMSEELVITWWDSADFEGRDLDKAFNVCDDALDVCIGHISDTVADFVPAISEGEN
jgi:hypothetical protein